MKEISAPHPPMQYTHPLPPPQEAQGRMLLSVPPHLLALLAAAGNSTTVVAGGGHRDVTGWHPGVLTGNTWVCAWVPQHCAHPPPPHPV